MVKQDPPPSTMSMLTVSFIYCGIFWLFLTLLTPCNSMNTKKLACDYCHAQIVDTESMADERTAAAPLCEGCYLHQVQLEE